MANAGNVIGTYDEFGLEAEPQQFRTSSEPGHSEAEKKEANHNARGDYTDGTDYTKGNRETVESVDNAIHSVDNPSVDNGIDYVDNDGIEHFDGIECAELASEVGSGFSQFGSRQSFGISGSRWRFRGKNKFIRICQC